MNLDLSILNKEQLPPVLNTEGAVMVTAGAGSGKTRLLTHRIAYIVSELNIPTYNILAITFTNKAAKEMKERLEKMFDGASRVWVSTFHSMCVTILRRYISHLGYDANFSIYDESERKNVIKKIAMEIDESSETLIEKISYALSSIKNEGMDIDEYVSIHKYLPKIDDIESGLKCYQETMKKNNALDFDDLLVLAYRILFEVEEAREHYQNRFKYIHVDEFQDTNIIQYKIIKLLAAKHKNLFVVGDEDQSIYGWRGANIGNIKDFLNDFECKIYKLEQNYRSTKSIISLANTVIKNNSSRIEKKLWTENEEGAQPLVFVAGSDGEEADFVMQNIKGLYAKGTRYSDMAVLMRVNSLSRSIEQKFMFYNIPYKVYGGFKFYDRKEIKDALAYLKILSNPNDNQAAIRVINFPKKGIGEASINKLLEIAESQGTSIIGAILGVLEQRDCNRMIFDAIPNAIKNKILPFANKLKLYFENKDMAISALLKLVYKIFEFEDAFSAATEENESKLLNLRELVNSIIQTEKANPNLSLDDYIQQIMLYSDMDSESSDDAVTIATVHSAKGLEYDTVFIVGLEEGLFPISRAMDESNDLEEERRLMYVAATRAKKRLFLSYARVRFMYGKYKDSVASRFLKESEIEYNDGRTANNYKNTNSYKSDNHNFNSSYSTQSNIPSYSQITNLPKSNVDINSIRVGTRIRHKRFGEGTIASINFGAKQADIEFESMGKVTLSIGIAPIEIIDD